MWVMTDTTWWAVAEDSPLAGKSMQRLEYPLHGMAMPVSFAEILEQGYRRAVWRAALTAWAMQLLTEEQVFWFVLAH